jgi:hypothetical protein
MQNGFIVLKSNYNDNEFIVIDPETGIVRDINTLNNFYGAYSSVKFIASISGGYSNPVNNNHQKDNLGTTSFYWDGLGKVYIASSMSPDSKIAADNVLMVTGPEGTASHTYADWSGVYPALALDITSILTPNDVNDIKVEIQDIYGAYIGCTPLILIETNEELYINIVPGIKFLLGAIQFREGVNLFLTGAGAAIGQPEFSPLFAAVMVMGGMEATYGATNMYSGISLQISHPRTNKSYMDQLLSWDTWV